MAEDKPSKPAAQDATSPPAPAPEDLVVEPLGGDVDVADVPDTVNEGEMFKPPTIEDSVILGDGTDVPEEVRGRRALVLEAPLDLVPAADQGDVVITVRTRDELNALLTLPVSDVAEIERGGSNSVRG